mgnify:FL=1
MAKKQKEADIPKTKEDQDVILTLEELRKLTSDAFAALKDKSHAVSVVELLNTIARENPYGVFSLLFSIFVSHLFV